MTVPVPYTWVDDTVATASLLNANISDPQSWMLGLPTFMGHNTTQQTIPASSVLKIQINVVDVNVGGFTHATDDTKVYVPEDGWYRWIALGSFDGTTYGATDNRGVWVYVNGVFAPGGGYTSHADTATNEMIFGGRTGLVWMNAGDYAEVGLYQSTPSSTDQHTVVGYAENETTLTLLWQGRDET